MSQAFVNSGLPSSMTHDTTKSNVVSTLLYHATVIQHPVSNRMTQHNTSTIYTQPGQSKLLLRKRLCYIVPRYDLWRSRHATFHYHAVFIPSDNNQHDVLRCTRDWSRMDRAMFKDRINCNVLKLHKLIFCCNRILFSFFAR